MALPPSILDQLISIPSIKSDFGGSPATGEKYSSDVPLLLGLPSP